jgi:ribose transport system substrate-binding protein
MDTDEPVLRLVKDGTIDSTIAQKPYTMALLGLKALDDIFHYPVKPLEANYALDSFSPFPAFIDTGVSLVDKSNVDNQLNPREDTRSQ